MTAAPKPPFLPQSIEAFSAHIADHQPEWFEYCRQAYEYINNIITDNDEKLQQAELKIQSLNQEITHLKTQLQIDLAARDAVIAYQKEQLREKEQELRGITKERDEATRLATPTVTTPALSVEPPAKSYTAAPMGAPASIDPPSSTSARLSERLPDPDKFKGERSDLRRFLSQIHEKMLVNRDRFPTPQTRMAYVTSRLAGTPYNQILPYIHRGQCSLSDYDVILELLERAFGDPNRKRNAQDELFRYRQGNREFGTFFAEFQRLALESEMSENALPTILRQAVNRELKEMMLHNPPADSLPYHELARFLQDLENRRMEFSRELLRPLHRNQSKNSMDKTTRTAGPTNPGSRTEASPKPSPHINPDAMDLSTASNRKTRRECYRCGSKEHFVRDCPHPDNRPARFQSAHITSQRSASPIPSETSSTRSPSPDQRPKGVSLA